MNSNNTYIILTASVSPKSPEWEVDPISVGLRFDQYCSALSYYAKFADVIFIENTDFNYDWNKRFDGVFDLFKHKLHVVKIPYYSGENPKFVGEYQCIRAGLKKVQELNDGFCTRFIKVTGRVIVPNFDKVLEQYSGPKSLGTLMTQAIWSYEGIVNISTWLFASHIGLLNNCDLLKKEIPDNLSDSMEHYLWESCVKSGITLRKFNPHGLDPILVPYYQGLYYDWIQEIALKSWDDHNLIPAVLKPFSY